MKLGVQIRTFVLQRLSTLKRMYNKVCTFGFLTSILEVSRILVATENCQVIITSHIACQ